MIFETERLLIRKLVLSDLDAFHEMQSNPKVMQFADGDVKKIKEHRLELLNLIKKYQQSENDFWIYAIERKIDKNFIGTLALVKDDKDDEIGYRFLEKYWGLGYGFEVCEGLVLYCKSLGLKKMIGYVVDENLASVKILKKCNFKIVKKFINDETNLPETKYELIL